jgi:2-methylisocitrate lyase-like PEP mutase family enzyme
VTVDFEAGYAADAAGVRETVARLIATGAVGLNLEDTRPGTTELRAVDEQVARLRAVRDAAETSGVPLVLNARADGLVRGGDWEETRTRALAYLDAGADAAFFLGLADEAAIARAVEEIPGPVALIARPSSPALARLAELGVARVSFAGGLHALTLAALRDAGEALLSRGAYPASLAARP